MTEPVVALSIDDVPSYSWLARRCIESLRRTGTQLDVVVFVSAGAALDVSDLANVELITVDGDQHASVYIENWYRLSRLEAERVVFLAADTVCFEPLELLLDRYRLQDVYARQEAGTQRPQEEAAGPVFPAQVDWHAFDRQRHLSDRALPVVNTGVMVFNHCACRRITERLDRLCAIYDGWASGAVPYPCSNRHIMDELAFSAALRRTGRPTLGLLSPKDAPFYAEFAAGAECRGIVLHVWSGLYRTYLQERGTGDDVAEYDFQQRRDALRRVQRASRRPPTTALSVDG